MRRFASRVVPSMAAVRHYTPAEDLKKLFQSDFEKQDFPASVIPSDSTTFAQFLYKSAEPKNAFDTVLKDFDTLAKAAKTLPVFWERTADIDKTAEFKALSPAMLFTIKWMQANGMLNIIPSVRDTFETYVNAKKLRVVAKIYLPGPEKAHAADAKAAKEAAKALQAETKAYAKHAMDFIVVEDADIKSGWAVDAMGQYINAAKGLQSQTAATAKAVDYTNVPAAALRKTFWEHGVEADVLGKYINNLSQVDAEEQVRGV